MDGVTVHGLGQDAEPCIAVEQALLGALLWNPRRSLAELPPDFKPEHYLDPLHRDIHEAIVALDQPDLIAVCAAMGAGPEERSYLASLHSGAVNPRGAPEYARAVTEHFLRREIEAVFKKAVALLARPPSETPASSVIQTVVGGLDGLISGASTTRRGSSLDTAMDEAIEETGKAMRGELTLGVSTGMKTVDDAIGLLEPSTFVVLAARPGMGKTALGIQWGINVARACKEERAGGVLTISLEMSRRKLARRTLAEASRIGVKDLARGNIDDARMARLIEARFALGGLPIWIEDAGGQSLAMIRQKCRTAARKFKGLRLIIVDHIQIVRPEDMDRRNGGTQAIGHISNSLRDLSKEFDACVLALSQLSRDLLKREDKRPNLGDLRQAGDIEQDADVVTFLHREEMFLGTSEPTAKDREPVKPFEQRCAAWRALRDASRGKAELIAAKVRDGEPQTVRLNWDGPTTSFSEPARQLALIEPADLMDFHDEHYGAT